MDKIAIAILNYNGEDFLRRFLPSFLKFSSSAPIYVIDNKSTDDSIRLLKNEFPEVGVIPLKSNTGYAGGYNEGLKQIKCEYVAIVNSDIEVTADWLHPLVAFLDENENCVAVQPKIRSFSDKDRFEYAGAAGGFLDKLGYPFCRGRIFDKTEVDTGQYDDVTEVFWTSGACFVVRKEAFEYVGGFDTDFFAHMEEIDLCWRLKRDGYNLFCIPQSTVYHVGGGTLSVVNPTKTFLNFRNGLALLLKNLPATQLYKLPLRMLLDLIAALKFTLDGDGKHAIAVMRAHYSFSQQFRRDYLKRSGNYSGVLNKQSIQVRSVVWKRFITGVDRFSKL
jgi:GT2 family glycosyltransferase